MSSRCLNIGTVKFEESWKDFSKLSSSYNFTIMEHNDFTQKTNQLSQHNTKHQEMNARNQHTHNHNQHYNLSTTHNQIKKNDFLILLSHQQRQQQSRDFMIKHCNTNKTKRTSPTNPFSKNTIIRPTNLPPSCTANLPPSSFGMLHWTHLFFCRNASRHSIKN